MSKNEEHKAFSGMLETFKRMLEDADEAYGREDFESATLLLNAVADTCGEAAAACAVLTLSDLAVKRAEADEAAERARRN